VDFLVNRQILASIINQEQPATTIDLWLSGNCTKHKAMADTVEFSIKLINWNVPYNIRIFG
jgi:hypothetical protein